MANGDGTLDRRAFDGAAFGSPAVISGPDVDGINWALVRGSFMANGTLYTAQSDGTMKSWTWDGTRFVNPLSVPSWVNFSGRSALAYFNGRIFYTSTGNSRLSWRRFSLESGIVGAEEFVADTGASGVGWNDATGLTVAGGKLYTSHSSGNLTRTDADGNGFPIPATTVAISGPAVGDGRNWNVVDLFVFSA
ncbi:MAG: hypothetical protein WKF43_09125 [Acidimicrobiales bacterium]